MEKMLVDAQKDINKSKEMFQIATSEVKQIEDKIQNAKSKLRKMELPKEMKKSK